MTLVEKINNGIKEAMRNREMLRLDVLRMLKSKILAADARGQIADIDVIKLFKTYFGNLQEAYEQAKEVNRPDIYEKLHEEMLVVSEFLPSVPTHEETRRIVQEAIEACGAKSKKDFGLIMKAIKQINPNIDGKMAKEIADHLLGD